MCVTKQMDTCKPQNYHTVNLNPFKKMLDNQHAANLYSCKKNLLKFNKFHFW